MSCFLSVDLECLFGMSVRHVCQKMWAVVFRYLKSKYLVEPPLLAGSFTPTISQHNDQDGLLKLVQETHL